jgi:hypothetical protein
MPPSSSYLEQPNAYHREDAERPMRGGWTFLRMTNVSDNETIRLTGSGSIRRAYDGEVDVGICDHV